MKNEKVIKFLGILMMILAHIIGWTIGGIVFWGLGNFAIWVFKVDYVWTFWHGLLCEFVYIVLSEIFKGAKNDN